MTHLKSAFIAAVFACAGAQAQTADSPAATKSADALASRYIHPALSHDRSYAYDYEFAGGASVSFEIMQRREPTDQWFRGKQVHNSVPILVELELNEISIEPRIIDHINVFLRSRVGRIVPGELEPVTCTVFGEPSAADQRRPCEEIRLKFRAEFIDDKTFTDFRTGEYNGLAGACTIFIDVRKRDVSWWCYSDGSLKLSSSETASSGN